MIQPGGRLGNYEIVEKIGAGGMGAVYKGYQTALGRYVAIKVLPPQTAGDPTFADRFAQEARAIGKLRHPNIVTAFDFAHEGDVAYLVSEFIDGGTLADQLGSPLPLDYTTSILTPIAAALDYAHARGIVHRDIKPQNILMTRDGMPVLTDFGLAKIVGPGSGMTQAGSLMGTAEYIAPENAAGAEAAGPAADQYALGLIAYQMLTGRHPFPTDNPLSALMAHVHKPVPIPSSLGVVLPPGAEAALLRALAKRPEERFARCGELVRALTGSVYGGLGAATAVAPAAQTTSPSQPPTVPPTIVPPSEPQSAILSPSALVRPVERPPSTPPTTPASSPTVIAPVAGGGGGAAATVIGPARPLPKAPRWWRRRRMLVLVPILLFLTILSLPRQDGRTAGATSTPAATEPQRTPARTQGGGGPATTPTPTPSAPASTVATAPATVLPVPTVTPVRTPTPATPTPVPPTATPVPSDDYGNTPATATTISPGLHNGTIEVPNDADFFRFTVNANTLILCEFRGNTLAGGAIALLQGGATGSPALIVEETDNGSGAKFSYTAASAGVYYIRVRSTRGDTGTYSFGLATQAR